MKKLLLALAFISMQAQAQTTDEYVSEVAKNYKPISTAPFDLVCGEFTAEIQVRNQEVTLFKSSKNTDFDNSALNAAKTALDKSYVGWIVFPITTGADNKCPALGDYVDTSAR